MIRKWGLMPVTDQRPKTDRQRAMRALVTVGTLTAFALLPTIEAAHSGEFMVSRPEAIDGRTFESDGGKRYRLHAVDAPELGQECLDPAGTPYACGESSRRALGVLIDGLLTCRTVAASDTANPPTVRCTDFAGRDIGAVLVSKGWAVPDRQGNLDYVFEEMEAEARAHGLWNGRFVLPARWRAGARL